jgi:precorrin-6x reductase
MHDSLTACEELGIPHRNIIAMQGPFSIEINEALLRQYQIRYLVTKDGGKVGGFEEKVVAARHTGAQLVVISRPEEGGGASLEEILQECKERGPCR